MLCAAALARNLWGLGSGAAAWAGLAWGLAPNLIIPFCFGHDPQLMAVSLMVFFVLACQCMSTVAVVRRETNSWRWPIFMVVMMNGLAWIASLAVYQGGKLMGLG